MVTVPSVPAFHNACTQTNMAGVTADGNNHISGLSYDTSGNTLTDGSNTYTWDSESQLKTAAGITYTYDGDGRRAAKVGSKLYWYGSGGEILSETNASGATLNDYIFFGGRRVAMVPATGSALFYAEDTLGTSRVIAQSTGTLCYDADFVPFGGEKTQLSTCPQNYKFEGKERDAETQNDDFGARYYSWRLGRWLSSDWSAVPIPVPYANLTNPQTLNLYSMVEDDPESFADLDGHLQGVASGTEAANACAGNQPCAANKNIANDQKAQNTVTAATVGAVVGGVAGAIVGGIAGGTGGTLVEPGGGTLVGIGLGGTEGAKDGAALGALIGATLGVIYSQAKDAVSGPKAADAPGVTAGNQATNEHGQKVGPSGKPQVNNVSKNTREGANNAANKGSGTINHANPARGEPHFHTKRGDGSKKQDSTHYNYPD